MQTLHDVKYLRAAIRAEKKAGKRVALVPTMGNLHKGHLQLVRRAKELADYVVVSIFVNPMQFGESKDLDSYPRTLAEDQAKLQSEGADLVFVPNNEEIYPNGTEAHTKVNVDALDGMLEGASRKGHFEGVCTVVNKLFNLVQPTLALFGEKDFQQLAIVTRMVEDLCMPVDIVGVPTVREDNGLAMSSRNGRLNDEERERSAVIYRELRAVRDAIVAGQRDFASLCLKAREAIAAAGLRPDYFDVRDAGSLATVHPQAIETSVKKLVILTAAYMGDTRLLDNISFELPARTQH